MEEPGCSSARGRETVANTASFVRSTALSGVQLAPHQIEHIVVRQHGGLITSKTSRLLAIAREQQQAQQQERGNEGPQHDRER